MTKLLVVDDSPLMRRLLGQLFEATGDFEVAFARDGTEAIEAVKAFDPDVVTLDVHMPGLDGLACLDRIMLEYPRPVVMVSAFTDDSARETLDALHLGAVDFVAKPSGAVSLEMEMLGPKIVEKVRAAAQARVPRTLRLTERVRMRNRAAEQGAARPQRNVPRPRAPASKPADPIAAPTLVLVGTSTGGPAALDVLLSGLSADFPAPILVAQHMPATFTAQLAARLDRLCPLKVMEVRGPTALVAGHVYVGRGDADLIVSRRGDELIAMPVPASSDYRWHPSVDRLVDSAMEHVSADELVAVLMTGMGDDGARAIARLKVLGGRTIAEDEATSVVWGMPGELVRLGGADAVLPLDEISSRLLDIVK